MQVELRCGARAPGLNTPDPPRRAHLALAALVQAARAARRRGRSARGKALGQHLPLSPTFSVDVVPDVHSLSRSPPCDVAAMQMVAGEGRAGGWLTWRVLGRSERSRRSCLRALS
eukprot:704181-Rhodomonas_salina.5